MTDHKLKTLTATVTFCTKYNENIIKTHKVLPPLSPNTTVTQKREQTKIKLDLVLFTFKQNENIQMPDLFGNKQIIN